MPEREGGGKPPERSSQPSDAELSPAEEERLVERIVQMHEDMLRRVVPWPDKSVPEDGVVNVAHAQARALDVSREWMNFVRDLVGISPARFDAIKEKKWPTGRGGPS